MTSSMGISSAGMQASAAVFNVDAVTRQPQSRRDDVVAPIDTTNGEAAKSDLSLIKMGKPSVGQTVDFRV